MKTNFIKILTLIFSIQVVGAQPLKQFFEFEEKKTKEYNDPRIPLPGVYLNNDQKKLVDRIEDNLLYMEKRINLTNKGKKNFDLMKQVSDKYKQDFLEKVNENGKERLRVKSHTSIYNLLLKYHTEDTREILKIRDFYDTKIAKKPHYDQFHLFNEPLIPHNLVQNSAKIETKNKISDILIEKKPAEKKLSTTLQNSLTLNNGSLNAKLIIIFLIILAIIVTTYALYLRYKKKKDKQKINHE